MGAADRGAALLLCQDLRGKQTYTTTCLGCGTASQRPEAFDQLVLHVKGMKDLAQSFAHYQQCVHTSRLAPPVAAPWPTPAILPF